MGGTQANGSRALGAVLALGGLCWIVVEMLTVVANGFSAPALYLGFFAYPAIALGAAGIHLGQAHRAGALGRYGALGMAIGFLCFLAPAFAMLNGGYASNAEVLAAATLPSAIFMAGLVVGMAGSVALGVSMVMARVYPESMGMALAFFAIAFFAATVIPAPPDIAASIALLNGGLFLAIGLRVARRPARR